jgi:hypothetical protein
MTIQTPLEEANLRTDIEVLTYMGIRETWVERRNVARAMGEKRTLDIYTSLVRLRDNGLLLERSEGENVFYTLKSASALDLLQHASKGATL